MVAKAKLVNEKDGFVRAQSGSIVWKLTPEGIVTVAAKGPWRTLGEPATLTKINAANGAHIDAVMTDLKVADRDRKDVKRLVLATIATESGGKAKAGRFEPSLNDYSFGMMQTLTRTAAALRFPDNKYALPRKSFPELGATEEAKKAWEEALSTPLISIAYGTKYLLQNSTVQGLNLDPVLSYCAYNAGGAYVSARTQWGLRYFGQALDHFVKWYGDACAVVK